MVLGQYELLGLHDVGLTEDIPEPFDTFEANAQAKALYSFRQTGIPSFSDDSGLAVDALDMKPGVLSARFAGPQKKDADNIAKVLAELENIATREARFVAVFAYQADEHQCYFFRGTVEGNIGLKPMGNKGFGYDPIFIPEGSDKTYAEMTSEEKNEISMRKIALMKFKDFMER